MHGRRAAKQQHHSGFRRHGNDSSSIEHSLQQTITKFHMKSILLILILPGVVTAIPAAAAAAIKFSL
jgi:hypothetical protein